MEALNIRVLKGIFRVPKDRFCAPKDIHVPQRGSGGERDQWTVSEGLSSTQKKSYVKT